MRHVPPQRFAFGRNWASFSASIDAARIDAATAALAKLIAPQRIAGSDFLDIGCGSGLSMLAALRLGARKVVGIDLDPVSVETATALLSREAPDDAWMVRERDALDLDPSEDGQFDIVYSWGTLHHTGAMWRAIDRAASVVRPGGILALAIYRKTALCGAWKIEKRFYASAGPATQSAIRSAYIGALAFKEAVQGRRFDVERGMDRAHDLHDWLGGYPYESAEPKQVIDVLERLGFDADHIDKGSPRLGLFGTGCHEYLAVKR